MLWWCKSAVSMCWKSNKRSFWPYVGGRNYLLILRRVWLLQPARKFISLVLLCFQGLWKFIALVFRLRSSVASCHDAFHIVHPGDQYALYVKCWFNELRIRSAADVCGLRCQYMHHLTVRYILTTCKCDETAIVLVPCHFCGRAAFCTTDLCLDSQTVVIPKLLIFLNGEWIAFCCLPGVAKSSRATPHLMERTLLHFVLMVKSAHVLAEASI